MIQFCSQGKWILLGEHAVVRGHPALVFPLESRTLSLRLLGKKKADSLKVKAETARLEEAIFSALALAADKLAIELPWAYEFAVDSNIPLGSGLGSSAALSVALSRFLLSEGLLPEGALFQMSLAMENIFHGSSSGIDVAAILAGKALRFTKGQEPTPISLAWTPNLYLSDTGERSSTARCVEKVMSLGREDLDRKMQAAVDKAQRALAEKGAFSALADALHDGRECFSAWGLLTETSLAAIKHLEAAGAAAVKPTGSGGGGFLLSLWKEDAPKELGLIPALIR